MSTERPTYGQNDVDVYKNWPYVSEIVHPGSMTLKQAAQMAFCIVELGGANKAVSGFCQDLAAFFFDHLRDPGSQDPVLLTARVFLVSSWKDLSDDRQHDVLRNCGEEGEPEGDALVCELLGSCGQYGEWCKTELAGPDKWAVAGPHGFGETRPVVQAVLDELDYGNWMGDDWEKRSGEFAIDQSVAVRYLAASDHKLKAPCMPALSSIQRSLIVGSALGLGARMPSGELMVVELLSTVGLPAVHLEHYRVLAMSLYVAWYANNAKRGQLVNGRHPDSVGEFGKILEGQLRASGTEELRHLLTRVIIAEDLYRRRLALDLHDVMTSQIGAVVFGMGNLTMYPPSDRDALLAGIKNYRDELGKLLKWVRCMSHELYPDILTKLGLVPALRHLVRTWGERVQMQVVSQIQVDERLDLDMMVSGMLYRIIQECLNNIEKHAAATTTEFRLAREAEGLSITITDNGRGFCLQTTRQRCVGIGLMGMGERIAIIHGRLQIDSKEGQGTRISLWVPLNGVTLNTGLCQ